jgi:outer membrane protein assembly factor BamB
MKRLRLVPRLFPLLILALIATSCTKPVSTAGGFDWPQWRGPDGNGQSRETEWDPAAIENPRVLWKVDIGIGYSNVVIQDGRLYTMGATRDGVTVMCLEASTGRQRWKRSLASTITPQATPAVEGSDLFVLTNEGSLHALDARSGKVKWRKNIVGEFGAVMPSYGYAGSPIIAGDLVILNANTAGMAVRRSTGELVWSSEAPPADRLVRELSDDNGATYMTPVLASFAGRQTALIYGWKGLSAVEPGTGKIVWTYNWRSYLKATTPDPVVAGENVFVADATKTGYQDRFCELIRITDGTSTVVWENHDVYSDVDTPLLFDGHYYLVRGGPYGGSPRPLIVCCLEEETGRVRWKEQVSNATELWVSLTAAGGTLIVLTENGTLSTSAASPAGFSVISKCDVLQGASKPRKFTTPPVLCNAKIYCRNFAGDLVCMDVSK